VVSLTAYGETILNNPFTYAVENPATTGFKIKISEPQSEDVQFGWYAFGSDQGKVLGARAKNLQKSTFKGKVINIFQDFVNLFK
jgi:hypothetical protein